MSIAIDYQRVKAKCGITGTDYDSTINSLISEFVPVIEYALQPEILADPDDDLEATLNLGATEIVCGEYLAQLMREPGAMDEVQLGDVHIKPIRLEDSKALDLAAAGNLRLKPFLKKDVGVLSSIVGALSGKSGEDE